jgi:putative PIN family toxin of toxin-antitoxin system
MAPKAVLDTNVLVSGLVSDKGPPRLLIDAWLDGVFTLVTSLYQIDELAHVLSYPRITRRINIEEPELELILAALLSEAEVTPGRLRLPGITRDPKDDPIVACALVGNADFIVSGDQDLLVMGEHKGIRAVTPREFLGIITR